MLHWNWIKLIKNMLCFLLLNIFNIYRLSLLEPKYRVIKTPRLGNVHHLGKSDHGIYYTTIRWRQLHAWVLQEASESRPLSEWELKYTVNMVPSFLQYYKRDDRN
jgi:hypothetical protein